MSLKTLSLKTSSHAYGFGNSFHREFTSSVRAKLSFLSASGNHGRMRMFYAVEFSIDTQEPYYNHKNSTRQLNYIRKYKDVVVLDSLIFH